MRPSELTRYFTAKRPERMVSSLVVFKSGIARDGLNSAVCYGRSLVEILVNDLSVTVVGDLVAKSVNDLVILVLSGNLDGANRPQPHS